jgi:hypothetical protein
MLMLGYWDLFVLRHIFESVLHKLQIISGYDNLWWAKKWIQISNVMYFIIAVFFITSTDYVALGTVLIILASIMLGSTSISLWKFITCAAGKRYLQHPSEIEYGQIMYQLRVGRRNPLEKKLMRARLMNQAFVLVLAYCSFYFYGFEQIFVIFCTITSYAAMYLMWLYIKSCTPATPQQICKQQKSKIFVVTVGLILKEGRYINAKNSYSFAKSGM